MHIPWRMIDQVQSVPLADGSVLFREDSAPRLFVLNRSAAEIWQSVRKGRRRDAAVRALMNRFGLSREESRRQVDAALVSWASAGLFAPSVPAEERENCRLDTKFYSEKTYRLCGRLVRVRYSTAAHQQQLHPRISHLAVDGSNDAPLVRLARQRRGWCVWGPAGPEQTSSSSEAVGLFFRTMIQAALPGLAVCAQFHAAAVARSGGAVLLPGRKGCGKTTLTAGLMRSGFDYLTDDVVLMDTDLKVVPLPLALSVKEGGLAPLARIIPDLAEKPWVKVGGIRVKYLPATASLDAARLVRAIVFPRFRLGAACRFRRLTPFECLRFLVDSGSWFSRERRVAQKWAAWLSETPGYALEYSELEDGIRSVREVAV